MDGPELSGVEDMFGLCRWRRYPRGSRRSPWAPSWPPRSPLWSPPTCRTTASSMWSPPSTGQLSHDQARMAATWPNWPACPGHTAPGQVVRSPMPDRFAPDETRAALCWTRRAADAEHEPSRDGRDSHARRCSPPGWPAISTDPESRSSTATSPASPPNRSPRICRIAVPRAPQLTTGQLAVLVAAHGDRGRPRRRRPLVPQGHAPSATSSPTRRRTAPSP